MSPYAGSRVTRASPNIDGFNFKSGSEHAERLARIRERSRAVSHPGTRPAARAAVPAFDG
jgi:hypothetical protein